MNSSSKLAQGLAILILIALLSVALARIALAGRLHGPPPPSRQALSETLSQTWDSKVMADHSFITLAESTKEWAAARLPGRAQGELLYDNGPLVNSPGTGVGGADESVLQNNSLGMTTLGFGHQQAVGNRIADDFTVTDPEGWTITDFVFYGYQTGSTTASTFTGLNLRIWDGVPGDLTSSVIYGDTTTNVLADSTFANIYRVTEDTTGTDTDRPIMANTARVAVYLPPGTYWVDWQADGTLDSGPWAPPITINGQTTTGNALQSGDGGQTYGAALDDGTNTPQGFPFLIHGYVGAVSIPEIGLAKTVGTDSATCADSSQIAVAADTEVTYCYRVSNTGTMTLTVHDLADSELGPILSGFPFTLTPGASLWLTQSTTIVTTTVNTATWTAYNPGPTDVVSATASAAVTVRGPEPLFCNGGLVTFDAGIPSDWTVNTSTDTGVAWTDLAGCGESGNWTGGDGDAACAVSDTISGHYDTKLISPAFDLSGFGQITLHFLANYQNFVGQDHLDVDISTDGGASWETLLSWNEDHGAFRALPGEAVAVDLSAYRGQSNVMLRWHYYDDVGGGGDDWYAQIDEVSLECVTGPNISLGKGVGTDPAVCASDNHLIVPPNAEVTYCYRVGNTGTMTLTVHDLADSELGTILSGFPFTLTPGASLWLTQSTTIMTTTVNTATWTAYNPGPTDVVSATASAAVTVVDISNLTCPAGAVAGALTPDDPSFNRPFVTAAGTCSPSAVGTNVHYDVYSYNLTGAPPHDLLASLCPVDGGDAAFDSVLAIYRSPEGAPVPFDPASPCQNLIGYSDDAADCDLLSRFFTDTLDSGYVDIVVTSFGNQITGTYTLVAESTTCTVPGSLFCNGVPVDFETGVPPQGWEVVDNASNGLIWTDSGSRGYPDDCGQANGTGATGLAACGSSADFGPTTYDTELRSAPFDLSGFEAITLTYQALYQDAGTADRLDLDISPDGGATWQPLLSWNESHGAGSEPSGEGIVLDLSPYAGQVDLMLRWRYANADPQASDWYAQVDNVALICGAGQPAIQVQPASLRAHLAPDQRITRTMTISNVGTAVLEWSADEEAPLTAGRMADLGIHGQPRGKPAPAEAAAAAKRFAGPLELGQAVWQLDAGAATGSVVLLGVEYAQGSFWLTAGGLTASAEPNYLFRVAADGTLLNTWPQPTSSLWGWRDLAFDGTFLYASDSDVLDEIDPATGTVTGRSIPCPANPCRALAYDPISDHFWTKDFGGPLYEFDRTGTVIRSFSIAQRAFGAAWDTWSPGGPYLWLWSQEGPDHNQRVLATQIDPRTGNVTGVAFLGRRIGSPEDANLAGGATISLDLIPGRPVLIGLHQAVTDTLVAYDLTPRPCTYLGNIPWLSMAPASGSLPPRAHTLVDVIFDATGLSTGVYGGNLCLGSNDIQRPLVVLPLELTVGQPYRTHVPQVQIRQPPSTVLVNEPDRAP